MPRLLSEEIEDALREIECVKAALSSSSSRGSGDDAGASYLGLRAPQDRLPLVELLKLSLGQLDRLREKEIEVIKASTATTAASSACFSASTSARQCAGLGDLPSTAEDSSRRGNKSTIVESQTVPQNVSDVTTWAACRALLDGLSVGDIRMVDSPVPRGDLSVAVDALQPFRWPEPRELNSAAAGVDNAGVGADGGGAATPTMGAQYRAADEAERSRLVAYLNAVLYPGCGNEWLVPVAGRDDVSDFLSTPCGDGSWRGRSRGNAEAVISRTGVVRGDAPSAAACLSEAVRCGAPSNGLRLLLEVVRPSCAPTSANPPSIGSAADDISSSSSSSGGSSRRGSSNSNSGGCVGGVGGAEGASGQAALYRAIAVLVAANRRSPLTRPVVVLTDLQDAWKLLWLGRAPAVHGNADVFVWRMQPADATSVVRSMLNDETAGWDGQVSWTPRATTATAAASGTGSMSVGSEGRFGRDGGRLPGDGPMASLRERHLVGKRRAWQQHRYAPSLPPPPPPPAPPMRERAGTEGMEHFIGGIVRTLSPPLAMEMALRRGKSSSFTGNSLPGQRIAGAGGTGGGSNLGDTGEYHLQPRESRALSASMYGIDRAGGDPGRSSFSGSYPRYGGSGGYLGDGFDDHFGGAQQQQQQQQQSNGHHHHANGAGGPYASGNPTPDGYPSGAGSGFDGVRAAGVAGRERRGKGRGGSFSSDNNVVARRSSSPLASAGGGGAGGDPAILRHIIPFAAGEGFLFVAGVCSGWRDAWGVERPPETSVDAAVQTPSRLGWARACGLGFGANVCERAAAGGHLATLRYARTLGCPWDWRTCAHAVTKALVPVSEMIQWAASKPSPSPSARFLRFVRDDGDHGPSQERRLEVLKWCRENGCPWDESTTSEAAREGNMDVLRYARANGCPWNVLTCAYAAAAGHLEVLKWAREEEGCGWNEATCAFAAAGGHLDVIQWARENGCRWGEETCASAARGGRLEVLKWCRENGCPWGGGTCANAAEGGHFEVLKWCRENGCPWTEATCTLAAREGQFEILRWCRENGCSWGASTFRAAAGAENMEMLRFLFENGCPWDRRTCAAAAKNANLEVLKWLRSNGCPWDSRTLDAAAEAGAMDLFEWATSQRCPS